MHLCEGCGASFENSLQCCPYCGRAAPKPKVEVNVSESVNACPICHKNDRVEKVSVIFMHGSTETSTTIPVSEVRTDSNGKTYSTVRHEEVKGVNETKLAQLLKPPTKPAPPNPPSLGWLMIGIVVVLVFFAAPCNVLFAIPSALASGEQVGSEMFFIAACSVIPVILISLLLWNYNHSSKKHKEKLSTYNNSDLPFWKKLYSKWDSLYFCYRDGCVFVPGMKSGVAIGLAQDFINKD